MMERLPSGTEQMLLRLSRAVKMEKSCKKLCNIAGVPDNTIHAIFSICLPLALTSSCLNYVSFSIICIVIR